VKGGWGLRFSNDGGCTVSLVTEEVIEDFRGQVAADYEEATGIVPQIYVCRAEDGVSKL